MNGSRLPDPVVEVVLHPAHVVDGRLGVPASGEPHADAAPGVAGGVLPAAIDGVQPRQLALEAGPPRRSTCSRRCRPRR